MYYRFAFSIKDICDAALEFDQSKVGGGIIKLPTFWNSHVMS